MKPCLPRRCSITCHGRAALRRAAGAGLLVLGLTAAAPENAFSFQESAAAARAAELFAERCKKSGEFIHRTVDDVDGIFLLKLRPKRINTGKLKSDQYALDDPYGRDLGGDAFIQSLLRGSYQAAVSGIPAPGSPPRNGYSYVDAVDPQDGLRYRYTGSVEEPWLVDKHYLKGYLRFAMKRVVAPVEAPRFGVTYDDISTREQRDHWIAGSSLKVVDLKTNEVVAERIGYMMDRGQGSTAGGRSPWLHAADNACPSFYRNPQIPKIGLAANAQRNQTLDFVEKVLKPRLSTGN